MSDYEDNKAVPEPEETDSGRSTVEGEGLALDLKPVERIAAAGQRSVLSAFIELLKAGGGNLNLSPHLTFCAYLCCIIVIAIIVIVVIGIPVMAATTHSDGIGAIIIHLSSLLFVIIVLIIITAVLYPFAETWARTLAFSHSLGNDQGRPDEDE